MAKDYLNIIERALMMGISDKINAAVTGDIHVFGQFPDTEDLKFWYKCRQKKRLP